MWNNEMFEMAIFNKRISLMEKWNIYTYIILGYILTFRISSVFIYVLSTHDYIAMNVMNSKDLDGDIYLYNLSSFITYIYHQYRRAMEDEVMVDICI